MGLIDLFRGSSNSQIEVQLLREVLDRIPAAISKPLLAQLDAGVIKGVRHNASDIPGFSSFKYNRSELKSFENETVSDYTITDIFLSKNKQPTEKLCYTVFVSSGLLSGYSLVPEVNLSNVDLGSIDPTNFRLDTKTDIPAYRELRTILSGSGLNQINPSSVYLVNVNGTDYFHLRDVDDGDFIGAGYDGALYKVSHEGPFATRLENRISELWEL